MTTGESGTDLAEGWTGRWIRMGMGWLRQRPALESGVAQ